MYIVIDYETNGLEYYREDFKVISMATSSRNSVGTFIHTYHEGEDNIRKHLEFLMKNKYPIVVHNYQFEYGVTTYRFPGIELNWSYDTMRLVQVYDNGGSIKPVAEQSISEIARSGNGTSHSKTNNMQTGLGLQSSANRLLPSQFRNHKEPYYSYLRDTHGVKKGKEGANLHLLTPELLEKYNTADTEVTLVLFEFIMKEFNRIGYNPDLDHSLYLNSARLIAEGKGRGIKVDRIKLKENINEVSKEIEEIHNKFNIRFAPQINNIEQSNLQSIVLSKKTEKGQYSAWEKSLERETYKFKLNSGNQKTELFVEQLGMKPKFFTKGGKPAFAKAFLNQWGEGGKLLESLGTLRIELVQMKSLYMISEYDGRFHPDLRAASTKTGRMAGGKGAT